jgi:hypothetical protein
MHGMRVAVKEHVQHGDCVLQQQAQGLHALLLLVWGLLAACRRGPSWFFGLSYCPGYLDGSEHNIVAHLRGLGH